MCHCLHSCCIYSYIAETCISQRKVLGLFEVTNHKWTSCELSQQSQKLVFFRKYCDELSCQWMPPMFLSQNCDFILSIALLSIFLQHWMFSNVALIIFHEIGQSTPKNLLLFPKDVTRMSTNPRNRFDNILCYKSIVFAKRHLFLFRLHYIRGCDKRRRNSREENTFCSSA